MEEEHIVIIGEGEGIINLDNGNYNAVSEVYGYDNSTLTPSSVEITSETNEYNFTVSASGSLIIYVYDGGAGQGNPIEGAVFYRCSSDGTKYGDPVTSNSTGFAYLYNLPYDRNYPQTVYYVQTASDGNHSFSTDVRSVYLTEESGTAELVENPEL